MDCPKITTDEMFHFALPSTADKETIGSKFHLVKVVEGVLHVKQKDDVR